MDPPPFLAEKKLTKALDSQQMILNPFNLISFTCFKVFVRSVTEDDRSTVLEEKVGRGRRAARSQPSDLPHHVQGSPLVRAKIVLFSRNVFVVRPLCKLKRIKCA